MEKILKPWQRKLHDIIYEADTPAGKLFDVILLILILFSVVLVMLESVPYIDEQHHQLLNYSEWIITMVFTIEYVLRMICVQKPTRYIFSFYGVIDFLSIIPKYISIIIGGAQGLAALRALRLLRVFRILKLTRYIGEERMLLVALRKSRPKILVFLFTVLILCVILGTLMYLIEGDASGFTSIPRSVYWCIVTLTTVGYGDIAPITPLGQLLASMIMILGYGIIAVPTGIVGAEIAHHRKHSHNTQFCPSCMRGDHLDDAVFCRYCGVKLNE